MIDPSQSITYACCIRLDLIVVLRLDHQCSTTTKFNCLQNAPWPSLQGDPVQDKLYEASALHNVAVGKWHLGHEPVNCALKGASSYSSFGLLLELWILSGVFALQSFLKLSIWTASHRHCMDLIGLLQIAT